MTGRLLLVVAAILPAAALAQPASEYGQFAPKDAFADDPQFAYYGSENEWSRRMFSAENAAFDYKRRGQRLLLALLDGHAEQCVALCEEELTRSPEDPEALFILTCAWNQLHEKAKARFAARRALAAGLPPQRFLAGPLELLKADQDFPQLFGARKHGLVHGPMLGGVTENSATVWVRTASPMPVAVRVFENEAAAAPLATFNSVTTAAADRTATVRLTGLEPSRTYSYDVLVDSQPVGASRVPLRTAPPLGKPAKFAVAFGGGAGFTPEYERMWQTILAARPDSLLMLGDNVYIDLPEQPGPFHRYTYYCRQSRPEWRRLVASTPVYAIWDDHDCAIDDVWMGPYLDRPAWKPATLGLFKENWNNPAYGDERAPGCWFRFARGDVDFFMLDCRFYRTNPFARGRTMLGPVQKSWLLEALKKSQATFKVIASSVPWAPAAKPGSHDTWDGFPEERDEIFSTIQSNRIPGVVLVSADRHRSDAWKIERPGGYALYDFSSSRLTNIHTHECMPAALFCYNEKCSFGLLNFDTEADDPLVVYKIVNIDGQTVHELKRHRSALEL